VPSWRGAGAGFPGQHGAPAGRDTASAAASALAAAAGAWCVRVHDVRGSLDTVRVAAAWNAPSGWEKGGNHAICGAVPGGVPGP
jgi:dihydropteroate synthase